MFLGPHAESQCQRTSPRVDLRTAQKDQGSHVGSSQGGNTTSPLGRGLTRPRCQRRCPASGLPVSVKRVHEVEWGPAHRASGGRRRIEQKGSPLCLAAGPARPPETPVGPVRGGGEGRQRKGFWDIRDAAGKVRAAGARHPPGGCCSEGRKDPVSLARPRGPDSKDNRMRSADTTERAAGQRPEHWGSPVSLGSKPQCPACPAPAPPARKNGPFELPSLEVTEAPLPRLVHGWGSHQGLPAAQEPLAQEGPLFRAGAGHSRAGPGTAASLGSARGLPHGSANSRRPSVGSQGPGLGDRRLAAGAPSWLQTSTPSLLALLLLPEPVLSQSSLCCDPHLTLPPASPVLPPPTSRAKLSPAAGLPRPGPDSELCHLASLPVQHPVPT